MAMKITEEECWEEFLEGVFESMPLNGIIDCFITGDSKDILAIAESYRDSYKDFLKEKKAQGFKLIK
jgi:hypothetical protein